PERARRAHGTCGLVVVEGRLRLACAAVELALVIELASVFGALDLQLGLLGGLGGGGFLLGGRWLFYPPRFFAPPLPNLARSLQETLLPPIGGGLSLLLLTVRYVRSRAEPGKVKHLAS